MGQLARLGALLLCMVASGSAAGGIEEDAEQIHLKVGRPTPFSPGFPSVQIICDDPSVVKVETNDAGLVLTGLKPGRTLCSFWRQAGMRRLYRVTVTEK